MESADPQSINSMRDTAGPYNIYAISDRRSINLPPKPHPSQPISVIDLMAACARLAVFVLALLLAAHLAASAPAAAPSPAPPQDGSYAPAHAPSLSPTSSPPSVDTSSDGGATAGVPTGVMAIVGLMATMLVHQF
jgi:hypothetical protein